MTTLPTLLCRTHFFAIRAKARKAIAVSRARVDGKVLPKAPEAGAPKPYHSLASLPSPIENGDVNREFRLRNA